MLEIIFWICAALLIYGFFGYPVLLYLITINKKKHTTDENFYPTISILVAAYNEQSVISKKLENLLDLDYPKEKIEILIGSDNSSDDTVRIAKKHTDNKIVKVFDFKLRRGKLGTMNAIAREAKGDVLVLTDANCMFDKKSLLMLARHFSDAEVGCVAGEKTIIKKGSDNTSQGEGIYWKIEAFLRQKESNLHSCAGADGAIYAVRKSLYVYPPENLLLMDDFIVSLSVIKQKYRCVYEPSAKAFEESSSDLRAEFKRKGRILAGAVNALRLVPTLLIPFYSPIAFQLWSHKIVRWTGGIFLLLLVISNVMLVKNTFYATLLIFHIGFYLVAALGYLFNRMSKRIKVFYIPFYFLFMNFSQLFGISVLVKEGKRGYWERVGR